LVNDIRGTKYAREEKGASIIIVSTEQLQE